MALNHKTKVMVCLVTVFLILISSYVDSRLNKPSSKFDTIEKTLNYIDNLDNRLIDSKDNKKIYNDLLNYINGNFTENETMTQEYIAKIISKYSFTLKTDSGEILLDNKNSVCKLYNTILEENTKVRVINSTDDLNKYENYIYITDSDKNLSNLYKYKNIEMIIVKKDSLVRNQSIVIEDSDKPVILYIDTDINIADGDEISVVSHAEYEDIKLNNIYTTIKNSYANNAVVVTAHYDTTTSSGDGYSNGILDNGSGIAVVMDMLIKAYESKLETNYDIIFAFVNSNENMIRTENSGSYQLNKLLSEKYDQILNINVDSVGQKNARTITYGTTGRVSSSLVQKFVINNMLGDKFNIERSVVSYNSDNLNFINSVYFYSLGYNGKDIIQTDKDTIDNVDIDKISACSDFIYRVLRDICKTSPSKLFKFY